MLRKLRERPSSADYRFFEQIEIVCAQGFDRKGKGAWIKRRRVALERKNRREALLPLKSPLPLEKILYINSIPAFQVTRARTGRAAVTKRRGPGDQLALQVAASHQGVLLPRDVISHLDRQGTTQRNEWGGKNRTERNLDDVKIVRTEANPAAVEAYIRKYRRGKQTGTEKKKRQKRGTPESTVEQRARFRQRNPLSSHIGGVDIAHGVE